MLMSSIAAPTAMIAGSALTSAPQKPLILMSNHDFKLCKSGRSSLPWGSRPMIQARWRSLATAGSRNVIDAMQYERIASRSGPTEGPVVGRQTVRSRVPSPGCNASDHATSKTASARPSAACMRPRKRCWPNNGWAKKSTAPCSSWMSVRSIRNTTPTFHARRESHGIRYVRSRVSSIHEDPASGDLILHYANSDGRLAHGTIRNGGAGNRAATA